MTTTLREEALKFGKIKEVDGAEIILHADVLEREFSGTKLCAEVGAYVNCGGSHGNTICTINKVQITEVEKTKRTEDGIEIVREERKVVTLTILGCAIHGKFSRGTKRLPTINCDTYFLSSTQVNQLIGIDLEENKEHFCVTDISDDNQTYLNLDKLMGRHTAILGTTGSGKSCTVASIVQSILSNYECPRILFFDIHNEYPSAFGHNPDSPHESFKSRTNSITWSEFSLPYWFLDLEEFFGVYNLEPGSNQKAIIKRLITKLKEKEAKTQEIDNIIVSADTPIFFDIDTLLENLNDEKDSHKNATDKKPYESIILKIQAVRHDTRYSFLHRKIDDKTSIVEYFEFILGLGENEKYLNILDLSGLPAEVRAVCVGVISRLCFDFKYWDLDPENIPLNLVLEEAHTYIPEESDSKYNIAKERVERIAKEGRKYGVGLTIVTQRPSNVSTTVLSQCGTYIALRLTNDLDQNKIKRLLPDTLAGQVNFLPSLRDGEAFVSGDSINLPRKVQFKVPNPMPRSNDVKYHRSWKLGKPSEYSLSSLMDSWYKQDKSK
ncbi:ATP-binding protein [Shewanella scandinavica]|uniref:ATP-binding protein n=1 Tax=Shewanella scandinavica TaxID=3063538 RepID=A0ABU3FW62_9GAMM|nr:ATP-binding protein [Shewanella sp. SP2S1-2]MDT3279611.1 ATP-binding protein [Shewanella sp. SP2S1-2]